MELELEYLVIHQLIKEPTKADAICKLSDQLLSLEQINKDFVEKLHDLFTNHVYNYTHALFESNEEKFPKELNKFLIKPDDASFLLLTKNIMNLLVKEVKSTAAKGGYIVFAKYKSNKELFTINILRETKGFTLIDKDSKGINPGFINHLDLDKLAMACQIDINKLSIKQEKYIRITKNQKMADVSKYFYNWLAIDFEKISNTKENNEKLLDIVNTIDELPIIDDIRISRDEFKKQILNYVKSKPDKNINLKDMGSHFYPDNPNKLLDFAQTNEMSIDTEFKYHQATLKKLVKFDVEVDNIRLAFSYEDKQMGKIKIKGDTIIITSPQLVKRISEESSQ
ncbi:MAG: hypothetical protein WCR42_13385 [bacterium]